MQENVAGHDLTYYKKLKDVMNRRDHKEFEENNFAKY